MEIQCKYIELLIKSLLATTVNFTVTVTLDKDYQPKCLRSKQIVDCYFYNLIHNLKKSQNGLLKAYRSFIVINAEHLS